MNEVRPAREVFDEWGRDDRAMEMERSHAPRVKQALRGMRSSGGDCLEIGVGTGYALRMLACGPYRAGHCYGIDVSSVMVKRASLRLAGLPNVSIEQGDFLTWICPPAADLKLIFSMEVFYYLPDMRQGIARAHDLLSPGGSLWTLVNYYEEHQASQSWPELTGTCMQRWSKVSFVQALDAAGFTGIRQWEIWDPTGPDVKNTGTLCTVGVKANVS